jgi:hypothetical protein
VLKKQLSAHDSKRLKTLGKVPGYMLKTFRTESVASVPTRSRNKTGLQWIQPRVEKGKETLNL